MTTQVQDGKPTTGLVESGNMIKLTNILNQILNEEKTKRDRCLRIADRKFDKPSAYKSGAVVRCRRGEIWKDLKEVGDASSKPYSIKLRYNSEDLRSYQFTTENWTYIVALKTKSNTPNILHITFHVVDEDSDDDENYDIVTNSGELFKVMSTITSIVKKDLEQHPEINTLEFFPAVKQEETNNIARLNLYLKYIKNYFSNATTIKDNHSNNIQVILKEDESLHKWFKRSGPKGKETGWVDCNSPDGKGGYKSCGRKEGEHRSKYPACRPTPAGCKRKGKGKTWGKTK